MSDSTAHLANISTGIRNAIRAALPMPKEQYFTAMVPAKVINLEVTIASIVLLSKKPCF